MNSVQFAGAALPPGQARRSSGSSSIDTLHMRHRFPNLEIGLNFHLPTEPDHV